MVFNIGNKETGGLQLIGHCFLKVKLYYLEKAFQFYLYQLIDINKIMIPKGSNFIL